MIKSMIKRFIIRAILWLRILKRLQGDTIKFELGLLASAVIDTTMFTLRPDWAISPKSYFSGIVRSTKFRCSWYVRRGTDDIYSVMPEREGDVDKLIRSGLKQGDTFVDIGAHIGYYTVLAGQLVGPEGTVVAIEPVPETVEILKINCNLNHLRNVRIAPNAACGGECMVPISFSKGYYGMATTTKLGGGSVLVKGTTVDRICRSYSTVKMIKIDVEGAEYQVLCGASGTLKKTNYVILECSEDCDKIMKLLRQEFNIRKLAFTTYILAERHKGSFEDMICEPENYWQKRLSKDFSLGGVGFLGLGVQYNKWLYKARARALSELLQKRQINPSGKRILDIGAGTGFYIDYWKERGVKSIVGIDITEKSVSSLKIRYPNYKFIKADVSSKELPVEGQFDIITAFDVLFHIVEEDKFEHAIKNIKRLSHKQTEILVSDNFPKKSRPPGFYENHRTMARYNEVLANNGLKAIVVVPIFYLMSSPVDRGALKNAILETFLPRLWSVVHTICSLSQKLGIVGKLLANLVGFALYTVDGIILKYAEVGPSTKLMLIRVE